MGPGEKKGNSLRYMVNVFLLLGYNFWVQKGLGVALDAVGGYWRLCSL
jgi:hypothetical protein